MMKDMKWKQIDTTYAGKAYQVEAEEINLHGEVNITGSLSVNDSPLDAPTATGTSYDNTASGLTGTNVQDAVDELATHRIKVRNFDTLQDLTNFILGDISIRAIKAFCDNNIIFDISRFDSVNVTYTSTVMKSSSPFALTTLIIRNNGTTSTGWEMVGNGAPSSISSVYDNNTYQLIYI